MYLYGLVKRGRSELVVVLRVKRDLHHVMRMALEHLNTGPLLPLPQLDQHIVCLLTSIGYTSNVEGETLLTLARE